MTDDTLSRWIIDSATDFAIIATDQHGRVTTWNEGARLIFGWDESEMRGQTADRIFTPEDRVNDRAAVEMQCALETGSGNDERWHLRKDGDRFWASGKMMVLRNDVGGPVGFVKILRDQTEQRLSTETLRGSQTNIRLLMDSMAEGFYAVDREGVTTVCNAAFLRMMGFACEEDAVGRKLHDVIHKQHPDGSPYHVHDCPIYKCASQGAPAHVKNELFFPINGDPPMPVEYWAFPIRNDGELQGAICTFLPIGDQLNADERLQLALAAGAIVGTWVWDITTDTFIADDRFASAFGLSRDLCRTGLPLDQVMASIHEEDRSYVKAAIVEATDQGGPYRCQYRVRQQDGVHRWVEANGRVELNGQGKAVRFPGVLLDIEARRTAEVERDQMSDLLRSFTAAVPGVVYAKDRAGRLIAGNNGLTELLGRAPVLYLGKTDLEVLDDQGEAERVMATDRRIMDSGHAEQVEEDVRLADGSAATWLSTKAPLLSAEGEIIGLVGSSVDVTSRKAAEAEVRELNRTLEQRVAEAIAEREKVEDVKLLRRGTPYLHPTGTPSSLRFERRCAEPLRSAAQRRGGARCRFSFLGGGLGEVEQVVES